MTNDSGYQNRLLPGVSRTFALTIPQLPPALHEPVANAYLLCRIADTIEDDRTLETARKEHFHRLFVQVVAGEADPAAFAKSLSAELAAETPAAERELIAHTEHVIAVTHGLSPLERATLERCVRVMCDGMPRFQRGATLSGLPTLEDLDRYCYYVAGVVGEMLTELFCAYRPDLAPQRDEMMRLAVSFGQGLQMTNILKDIWEDRHRGYCWLPRSVFHTYGFDLDTLTPDRFDPAFGAGLEALIGIAYTHLDKALAYTLMIPRDEEGIRRFCLWALGLAVLTLNNIHRDLAFRSGNEVKVSRRVVKATLFTTSLVVRYDGLLRRLFAWAARGRPHSPLLEPGTH